MHANYEVSVFYSSKDTAKVQVFKYEGQRSRPTKLGQIFWDERKGWYSKKKSIRRSPIHHQGSLNYERERRTVYRSILGYWKHDYFHVFKFQICSICLWYRQCVLQRSKELIPAVTTNVMTLDFLSLISHGWVVTSLDSHRTVFTFRSWLDLLGFVLAFWISILKISKILQNCWHRVIDITSFEKHLEILALTFDKNFKLYIGVLVM